MVGIMTPAIAGYPHLLPRRGLGRPAAGLRLLPPGWSGVVAVVAMVHDWRTRGRPHPVYVYGGLALLAELVGAVALSGTRLDAYRQGLPEFGGLAPSRRQRTH